MNALLHDWNQAELNLGRDEFTEYLLSVLSLVANWPQGRDLRDLIREVLGDPLRARNFRILLSSVLPLAAKLDEGTIDFGGDTDTVHRIVECLRQSPVPQWRSAALPWLAFNPGGYHTLQFLTALDSLCLGLWVLWKNKTQTLRRLKAVAAEVLQEKEHIIIG